MDTYRIGDTITIIYPDGYFVKYCIAYIHDDIHFNAVEYANSNTVFYEYTNSDSITDSNKYAKHHTYPDV